MTSIRSAREEQRNLFGSSKRQQNWRHKFICLADTTVHGEIE